MESNESPLHNENRLNRKTRRGMDAMQRKGKKAAEEGGSNNIATPDAFGDHGWDDLHRIYLECQALAVQPARILPLLKDREKLSKVKDTSTLVEEARVLNKDVTEFNQRLQEIRSKHQERSGSSNSPDDLMACLSIGEEYQSWIESYQRVVQPMINSILTHFDTGEVREAMEGEVIPTNRNQ